MENPKVKISQVVIKPSFAMSAEFQNVSLGYEITLDLSEFDEHEKEAAIERERAIWQTRLCLKVEAALVTVLDRKHEREQAEANARRNH